MNLGIAGLNSVKIKATERMIASTGAPLLYHGPDARVPGCFDNLGLPFCFLSEISNLLICASGQESLTCYDNLSLHFLSSPAFGTQVVSGVHISCMWESQPRMQCALVQSLLFGRLLRPVLGCLRLRCAQIPESRSSLCEHHTLQQQGLASSRASQMIFTPPSPAQQEFSLLNSGFAVPHNHTSSHLILTLLAFCAVTGVFQWRAQHRVALAAHINWQVVERALCSGSRPDCRGRGAICPHWRHCGRRLCLCWVKVGRPSALLAFACVYAVKRNTIVVKQGPDTFWCTDACAGCCCHSTGP